MAGVNGVEWRLADGSRRASELVGRVRRGTSTGLQMGGVSRRGGMLRAEAPRPMHHATGAPLPDAASQASLLLSPQVRRDLERSAAQLGMFLLAHSRRLQLASMGGAAVGADPAMALERLQAHAERFYGNIETLSRFPKDAPRRLTLAVARAAMKACVNCASAAAACGAAPAVSRRAHGAATHLSEHFGDEVAAQSIVNLVALARLHRRHGEPKEALACLRTASLTAERCVPWLLPEIKIDLSAILWQLGKRAVALKLGNEAVDLLQWRMRAKGQLGSTDGGGGGGADRDDDGSENGGSDDEGSDDSDGASEAEEDGLEGRSAGPTKLQLHGMLASALYNVGVMLEIKEKWTTSIASYDHALRVARRAAAVALKKDAHELAVSGALDEAVEADPLVAMIRDARDGAAGALRKRRPGNSTAGGHDPEAEPPRAQSPTRRGLHRAKVRKPQARGKTGKYGLGSSLYMEMRDKCDERGRDHHLEATTGVVRAVVDPGAVVARPPTSGARRRQRGIAKRVEAIEGVYRVAVGVGDG